jgi:hypothetical protein
MGFLRVCFEAERIAGMNVGLNKSGKSRIVDETKVSRLKLGKHISNIIKSSSRNIFQSHFRWFQVGQPAPSLAPLPIATWLGLSLDGFPPHSKDQ